MTSLFGNFALHCRPEGLRIAMMKGVVRHRNLGRLGFLVALLLSTISLKANPTDFSASPIFQFGNLSGIIIAILVESFCVILLLRRRRTPRLFLLWLMGMHLVTYPVFLGLLWLSLGLHPFLAVIIGEGLIMMLEGSLIYLICRFAPSAKSGLPLPSGSRSLLASLVGNVCSVVVFPLAMILPGLIASSFEALIDR
jgi:hypothetical protein